jgi:hypothetical protein
MCGAMWGANGSRSIIRWGGEQPFSGLSPRIACVVAEARIAR